MRLESRLPKRLRLFQVVSSIYSTSLMTGTKEIALTVSRPTRATASFNVDRISFVALIVKDRSRDPQRRRATERNIVNHLGPCSASRFDAGMRNGVASDALAVQRRTVFFRPAVSFGSGKTAATVRYRPFHLGASVMYCRELREGTLLASSSRKRELRSEIHNSQRRV